MNARLVRRVAVGVAGLLGLVVIAALVFTATFDVNRYKPQFVDTVKQRTGRTLGFDGDLALTLFPRLAVKLPATTLSEPGRDAVFARLRAARASVALLPLLRRQVEIDGVRIDGLQATIVKQKDGSTNIDDLLKPKEVAAPSAPGAPPAASATTTIAGVQLKDADLTWRDLAANRTVRLSALDLSAGRYAPGTRMPLQASADVTSNEPALAAKVSLTADVEWSDQGDLRAVRGLALKADGSLNRQPVALDAKAEQLLATRDALDVRGLRLTASGKGEGGAPLELQLAAPRLEAGSARASGERIELTIARRGTEPLEAKVLVDGVRGTAERLEAPSVKIAGSSRSAQRTTRFDITTALLASLKDRTLRFDRATGEIVVDDPAFGKTPVRLPLTASGAIDGQHETTALQFETRGERLSARGRLATTGFSTPRISFDVDAEQIDADRYLPSAPARPASAPAAAPPAATAPPPAAPAEAQDAKVDLAALRDLRLDGTIRVARLRARGTDFSDVKATVKADSGRVDVAPFALRVDGGTVNGRVGIDAKSNRVTTAGSVSGLQLRSLNANFGGRAAVEGSASGTFDLATAGASTNQMKRALGGSVALEVRDGALVGIDLADLLGTASAFLQSRGQQKGALDASKRTPFSQLSASVRIKDGVATNEDLKAKSPQLDMTGRGTMDIVTTQLDYALQAQVLPGAATERSPLRSLAGLSVPVKVTGTIDKPSYTVDWAPIAAQLLVKRATGTAGTPSVDKVIEGLSDLLRKRKQP